MDDARENQEILQQFENWNKALQTGADDVVRLYAPSAVLVPTLSNELRSNHQQIRSYFAEFIRKYRPTARLVGWYIRFYGDTAINSGIYTFHFTATGETVHARYTFAYHRQEGRWLISEQHSSLLYSEMAAGKASLNPDF